MSFTIATNWDLKLIENIEKYPVESVFGKMTTDIVGGGRAGYLLKDVDKDNVVQYVAETHKKNVKFNYLLNASCLGNQEFTRQWQTKFISFIEWLEEIGVDGLVMTIPYLIQIVKKRFPKFKLIASTFCLINNVNKAKYYEDLGVDEITVDIMVNRDFDVLGKMAEKAKCQLTLYVNHCCLYNCPYSLYHGNIAGHGSQSENTNSGFIIDYCYYSCLKQKYSQKAELLKSRWIRPEDIKVYKEIGIDHFKIAAREKSTPWLLNALNAYSNEKYDGNLMEIFSGFSMFKEEKTELNTRFLIRPDLANTSGIRKFYETKKAYINIDNKRLNGFIEGFKKRDCTKLLCDECGYCYKIADEVVEIDKNDSNNYVDSLSTNIINPLINGDFYK